MSRVIPSSVKGDSQSSSIPFLHYMLHFLDFPFASPTAIVRVNSQLTNSSISRSSDVDTGRPFFPMVDMVAMI